jgi:hypothetical protein
MSIRNSNKAALVAIATLVIMLFVVAISRSLGDGIGGSMSPQIGGGIEKGFDGGISKKLAAGGGGGGGCVVGSLDGSDPNCSVFYPILFK